MHTSQRHQAELLRDVGDKSLLFCGLFPGIAAKRHVSLKYFSEMGQAAYLTVGELHPSTTANLYFQLSEQFIRLQHILQAMRGEFMHFNKARTSVLSSEHLTLQ